MARDAMTQDLDSLNPSVPQDTPLYAIFDDGEWYVVEEEIWTDIVLQAEDPDDQDDDEGEPVYA